MKVKQLSDKLRTLLGDSSIDVPEPFLIAAINKCFNELPRVPKLDKIFSRHYTFNLDAKHHYRWSLNGDFRRVSDIPMLNFFTSDGGEPCPLDLCNVMTIEFYNRNGIPSMKKPGIPCEYTIEQEGDEIWLVLDRPSNTPIIVDYVVYGYPKPVTSVDDEIDISAIAENLILDFMRAVWYWEADDGNFAGSVEEYLSNVAYTEAQQALYKRWGVEPHIILGENH